MKFLGTRYKKGEFPLNLMGGFYALIFLSLIAGGVIAGVQGNWDALLLSIASIALFLAPFYLEKQFKIYLPTFFCLLMSAFLYATIILGQVQHYYQKYWWWDIMLHSGSGIAFGLVGLVVILLLFRKGKIAANSFVLCLFAFCFALAVGLLWEVFEFSGDQIFHTNMQQTQTGVVDTMKDEIMDTIGALVGSAIGYFYLRKDTKSPLDTLLDRTIRRNKKKK